MDTLSLSNRYRLAVTIQHKIDTLSPMRYQPQAWFRASSTGGVRGARFEGRGNEVDL
jgi:hypothetical protein